MSRLIKDGQIIDNEWTRVTAETLAEDGLPADGKVIVPLSAWQDQRDAMLARGNVAVCLAPGEEPEMISEDLEHFELVAIDFPAFKDGRGYSYARELRQRYGFKGEVRAVGDVLQDQLFYMWRCGFNAFEVRADRDLEEALDGLKVFTVTYQGDVHEPNPIFRRRPGWSLAS